MWHLTVVGCAKTTLKYGPVIQILSLSLWNLETHLRCHLEPGQEYKHDSGLSWISCWPGTVVFPEWMGTSRPAHKGDQETGPDTRQTNKTQDNTEECLPWTHSFFHKSSFPSFQTNSWSPMRTPLQGLPRNFPLCHPVNTSERPVTSEQPVSSVNYLSSYRFKHGLKLPSNLCSSLYLSHFLPILLSRNCYYELKHIDFHPQNN